MRAFTMHGDELRLGLADVGELEAAVAGLGFERVGALWLRTFPGDAPYAAQAAMRFEIVAEQMVNQAAGLERARLDSALALVTQRARGIAWTHIGTTTAVEISGDAPALAAALADLLVEPLGEVMRGHLCAQVATA